MMRVFLCAIQKLPCCMQVMIVRDAPYMDSQITVGGLLQLSSVINDGVIQVIENPGSTIIERCLAPGFMSLQSGQLML
jgi:hypothetical protein